MSYTYRCPTCELAITSSEPLAAALAYCPRCARELTPADQDAPATEPPQLCPHGIELAGPAPCPWCANVTAGHLVEWSPCAEHGGTLARGIQLQQLLGGGKLWCAGSNYPWGREAASLAEVGAVQQAHWWDPTAPALQLLHPDPGAAQLYPDPGAGALHTEPAIALAPETGEGPAEHIRNALQILTGVLDYDGQLLPLTSGELLQAMQGVANRLYWAHQHPACDDRAKYELGIALGMVNGVVSEDPTAPGRSDRRDAAQFLRFRANAALVHQGDPVAPDPEQLRQLGVIEGPSDRGEGASNPDAVIVPEGQ